MKLSRSIPFPPFFFTSSQTLAFRLSYRCLPLGRSHVLLTLDFVKPAFPRSPGARGYALKDTQNAPDKQVRKLHGGVWVGIGLMLSFVQD